MDSNSKALQDGRRGFLKRSAAIGGAAFTAATLQSLAAHRAWANDEHDDDGRRVRGDGYGELQPLADQDGRIILALPKGFRYATFGFIGSPLLNGGGVHAVNLDGMAAFDGPGHSIRLIRNHEVRNAPGNVTGAVGGPSGTKYDAVAGGGTITIDYDPKQHRVVREFISLNGTIVNCAGGLAYRDAGWLTCEETVAGVKNGWQQPHGYTFLVSKDAHGTVPEIPLKALGRFSKEAAVADNWTGIVYQTEDPGSGVGAGFYRFLPEDKRDLTRGGKLQMLRVKHQPQYDAREGQTIGRELEVDWVTIANPDPSLEAGEPGCFAQGFALGGAKFNRLEGIYRGNRGAILFLSTSGGDAKNGDVNSDGFREGYGQLWLYKPRHHDRGTLELVYESTGVDALDSPDNLCVTPAGGMLFCEDDAGSNDNDTHPLAPGITDVNRLVGLGRDGQPFTFAVNLLNDSEFAGACFSPDGDTLFVNVFGTGAAASGMTCAISGPWRRGAL